MSYQVRNYSPQVLASYISEFTNTPYSSVIQKRQFNYLHNYLSHWAESSEFPQSCFSIIIEEEYIDASFTEDFSAYYVKNFQHHKRNCVRVHFFSNTIQELELFKNGDNSEKLLQNIQSNYIGYTVIRPLPFYFFGRTCLKIWEDKSNLISIPCKVSIFGEQLCIKSIPFQEQDKVLSVCATSALWSYFYSQPFIDTIKKDSPYQITKLATYGKVLPDSNELTGLNVEMICDCLHKKGIETARYNIIDDRSYTRILHIFLQSRIPAILILGVYNSDNVKLGNHAVVALGDRREETHVSCFNGDNIREIYVHDDRVGPFARLIKEELSENWIMDIDCDVSLKKQKSEYYKLTDIILGIYPKIRLPYKIVRDTSYNLIKYLQQSVIKRTGPNSNILDLLKKIIIDISLLSNSDFKRNIRLSSYKDKSRVLNLSLPKYVWIASFESEGLRLFDIIFDSTENKNGLYILDILQYTELSTNLLENLNSYITNIIPNKTQLSFYNDIIGANLLAFYQWYHRPSSSDLELSKLYGELHIPAKIKPEEFELDEIKYQEPKKLKYKSDVGDFKLEVTQKYYIWAIDADGNLLIGTEDENNSSKYKGHPTLLQGKKGRIAGELRKKGRKNIRWEINAHSGRYSGGIYPPILKKEYLTNVKTNFFSIFFPEDKFTINYDKEDLEK